MPADKGAIKTVLIFLKNFAEKQHGKAKIFLFGMFF
jgi:hypothetical protein